MLENLKIGGRKRTDLAVSIPLVRGIAEYSSDKNFKKELEEYLSLIEYDEKQVNDEIVSQYNFYARR